MPTAPYPADESDRLKALHSLRVLDTPPEACFDDLTELARATFGMPIALVSLLDEHRQWFKSAAGLGACETPREQSVCAHVVLNAGPVVIEDWTQDDRTRDNPLMSGSAGLRFYAGAPITLSTGETVGSFCVIDMKPRSFSAAHVRQLERMASVCASLLEMRRSTELLREAERLVTSRKQILRQFVENTPAAVAMFDTEMRYLVVADQWRKDYGLDDSDLIGRSHYEVFPEIGEDWKALHRRALAGEVISCDRDTFDRADGTRQYLRYQLQPWRDSSGSIGGIVMFTEDITFRTKQELEIERSRDLLKQTEALSGIGGWTLDIATNGLHWTDQTFAIHGMDREAGEPDVAQAIDRYAPEHRAMVASEVENSIAKGERIDFEAEIVRPDGTRVPVRAVGHPVVHEGRVVRLVGAFQDLTTIRVEQEQRDRTMAMLRAMSEGTSDLIFAKDLEGRFLFVNPAMEAFCGMPAGEILGRTDYEVMPESVAEICRRGDLEAVKRFTPTVIDEDIETPDGMLYFKTLKQPYRLSDGSLVGVITLCHDVTGIRQQEDERIRLIDTIKAITDASSDVIFVKDHEGRLIFCNPAFAEAMDRPIDGLIGTCDYDLLDEQAGQQFRRVDDTVMRTGEPVRTEECVTLPGLDGERIFYTEKHPYRLPDGTIGGVIGVGRDMTDIRSALERLRTSEERMSFALSAASVGFWDHDMVADRVYYADTWFTMLGYAPGELPMTSACFWNDLLHPDDREAVWAAHETYKSGRTDGHDVQCRLRQKNGSWRWIRDIGSIIERDSRGRPSRMVGVHLDIDGRKREQEMLATALVAANEGLWEWSVLDNRCYFDDMWYTLLGYEPGELPMELETWETLCHPEDLEPAQLALGRYLRGESDSYSFEHRLRTKQDTWKWVLGTGTITDRDAIGRPLRMVGVTMDIDDRKHAAETLEHALDAAEAANLAKSQFLANMSHEIRTPMTAIVGYAELMASDPELFSDRKQMQETAAIVQRNGEHLLALINDILDLTKIDAGKMTTESVRMDLLELIGDVHELHRRRASHKGIRLEIQQRDAMPNAVMADPVRIRQVVMNLVNNAIKFTESGSVTMRIEVLRHGLGEADDRPRLRLSVIDTGIGISEEQVTRLFTAFEQADDSMARRFGGTGLGLAISERLAELLGGDVLVRSRLGSGSTFTLDLPMRLADGAAWIEPGTMNAAAGSTSDATGAEIAQPLEGMRILLVEDGLDNQRLIAHHLRRAGATVSIANNGADGVEHVVSSERNGGPFDLVLMDMQMPVMDGYTAARTLREQGEAVPIVALTAHAMTGDRERCLDAGCNAYETKPITRARLIELCARLSRQQRRAA